MKFLIKFRKSVMLLVKFMMIASVTFSFIDVWVNHYPDAMLYRNGNYLIVFSFVLLLSVFCSNFGAFKIGIYRIHEIIYYFSISIFLTDFFTYLELSLIAKYLLNPLPIMLSMVYQIIVVCIGSFCGNTIYFQLYKARRMLAVFGDEEGFKLINKMLAIPARFKIEQGINTNTSDFEEIKRLIDRCDGVIICDADKNMERDILLYCYTNQKRTYLLPSITDVIINNSYAIQISDTPVLMGRNRGLTTEQTILKRLMDIFVSAVLLIITSPIMFIIALAIKLNDSGPVFFRQSRVTQNGKIFNILKFRSMVEGADQIGSNTTAANDQRITRIGRVIRPCRIDELPQLINVLKGDMSMVGPRPERVENVREYSLKYPEFDLRHRVKAGITGYAQIYGKYNTSPRDKLNMDLYYIETYSLLQDIKLMFLTFKTLFSKESTEGF